MISLRRPLASEHLSWENTGTAAHIMSVAATLESAYLARNIILMTMWVVWRFRAMRSDVIQSYSAYAMFRLAGI
jgi:hypothetical protein